MTQLPEEAINIGALTHANSLLRLWHQEPLTMEKAELMPDWESYREHLKDALTAAEPHLRAKWAEELERAMFKVESVHHFGFGYHGFKCLCGFESLRNRSRTEHITQAVRNLLEGAGE